MRCPEAGRGRGAGRGAPVRRRPARGTMAADRSGPAPADGATRQATRAPAAASCPSRQAATRRRSQDSSSLTDTAPGTIDHHFRRGPFGQAAEEHGGEAVERGGGLAGEDVAGALEIGARGELRAQREPAQALEVQPLIVVRVRATWMRSAVGQRGKATTLRSSSEGRQAARGMLTSRIPGLRRAPEARRHQN